MSKGTVSRACSTCGKTFVVKAHRALTAKFCSRACRKVRVVQTCPTCGTEIQLTPAFVREVNCCSRPCRWEWQRRHVNEKWLRSGQLAMKARWDRMSPQERRDNSNIEALLAAAKTERVRQLFSSTKMGDSNPMKRPEVAEKVSQTIRKKWSSFFAEQMRRSWKNGKLKTIWERGATSVSPNKKEAQLLLVLEESAPTFRFVGNGAFWIGPCASGKRRNPDFIDRAQKKAILLHGEYWHPQTSAEIETMDYEKAGWSILVVWSKDVTVRRLPILKTRLAAFASQP